MTLRTSIGLLLLLTGCAQRGAAPPPQIPPPYPQESWRASAADATIQRDGQAIRLVTGAAPSLAWDTTLAAMATRVELRTQLWWEEGGSDASYGVAFGVGRAGGTLRGCLLQISRGPRVRLAAWIGETTEPLGEWRGVPGAAPDADTPDPHTGALAIREVRLLLLGPGLTVEIDGVALDFGDADAACPEGRLGIFAGPAVHLRVPYFTVTEPRP